MWVGLRAASPAQHFDADQEFILAARGAGILGQATSHRRALHLLLMSDDLGQPPIITTERLTYLGNAGYHHGYGFDVLGFEVALLPYGFSETDYTLSPYAALVVPYWLLITSTIALFMKYVDWPASLKLRRDENRQGAAA